MDLFNETTTSIYRFIEQHIQERGYSPTLREIAVGCYLTAAGVMPHLDKLEQSGYVIRDFNMARTIRLLKPLPEQTSPTEAIYQFIVERIDEGEPPSQSEMAEVFHISEQTIRSHLKKLEAEGRIQRQKHITRGILLLKS
jgi:repressor LexA